MILSENDKESIQDDYSDMIESNMILNPNNNKSKKHSRKTQYQKFFGKRKNIDKEKMHNQYVKFQKKTIQKLENGTHNLEQNYNKVIDVDYDFYFQNNQGIFVV